MDPYDVLGLVRDATAEEIKAAYLDKAKTAHPDAGGSDEDFQMLKLAYDTLRDPKRRKSFDETGRVDQPQASNEHVAILQYFGQILQMLLQHMQQVPADTGNPVAAMIDLITEETKRVRAITDTLEAQKAYIEKILKRAKRKKKAKSVLLETVLQGTVGQINQKLAGEAEIQKMRDTILEALNGYDYETDKMPTFMQIGGIGGGLGAQNWFNVHMK